MHGAVVRHRVSAGGSLPVGDQPGPVGVLTGAPQSGGNSEPFVPTVTLHVNHWHYDGDDATGQNGLVDYNLAATVTGIGDGGPCNAAGCIVMFQGGMPDANNVIQPTSTPGPANPSDPNVIWGPGLDPFTYSVSRTRATVTDQIYERAAVYDGGGTLLADSDWQIASSLPVQGPDAALAGPPIAFLAKAALTQQDPCVEDFPIGPDTFPSSLNDEQRDCIQFSQVIQMSYRRTLGSIAKTYGPAVMKGVAVSVAGNLLLSYSDNPATTDPHEDPAYLQRINVFIQQRRQVLTSNPLTEPQKRAVAVEVLRQCRQRGISDQDCDRLPIFAPGADIGPAATHDADAIAAGSPAMLNRSVPYPDGWYYAPGAADNTCNTASATDRAGNHCDEYPFKSAEQGGPGRASLRLIAPGPNTKEGGQLGSFYTLCGVTVEAQSPYLVMPLVSSGVTAGLNTQALCAPKAGG